MAVEGGKKTKTGEIFNEFPDRVADIVLFVCAGYCVSYLPWAVWFAGLVPWELCSLLMFECSVAPSLCRRIFAVRWRNSNAWQC